MEKTSSPISRVKCEVTTCEYTLDGNQCVARSIEVTPKEAKNSQETDCATFIPKMMM